MKKIKFITIALTFSILTSLVGCSSTKSTTNTTNDGTQKNSSTEVSKATNAYFANMGQDGYGINSKTFISKVKSGEDMVILDTRKPADYTKSHIKGAINVPWGDAVSESLSKLPKNKNVVIYCYTSQLAGQVVALMNISGFKAQNVVLGWNLGLSKAEGFKDVIETKSNDFPKSDATQINSAIKSAVEKYFKDLKEVKSPMYKDNKISEENAKKLIDSKDKNIFILDIRKSQDFAKGHIEGAQNNPFAKVMQEKFNTLPKDKKIIVVCYTGQTAGQVTAVLRLLGYDAASLNGGMGKAENAPSGWINKSYPVVK